MSAWLISIVGIVVIGVLIELLLTDSPMSRFIRSIYTFFILFVIVQPLPGFFRNGIPVGGAGVDYNWNLIGNINALNVQSAQRRVEDALARAGFDMVIVTISHDHTAPTFRIEHVYVNAWHHSNAHTEIIRIVRATLGVRDDQITIV